MATPIVLRNVPITELPQAQVQASGVFDCEEFEGRRSASTAVDARMSKLIGDEHGPTPQESDSALTGELAFSRLSRIREEVATAETSDKRVEAVPVWTSFNGLHTADIVFQGVISDGAVVENGAMRLGYRDKDVSFTVSGTRGIFNTSDQHILAGNEIFWRFPEQTGTTPRVTHDEIAVSNATQNKFVACVVNERFSESAFAEMSVDDYLRAVDGAAGMNTLMPMEIRLLIDMNARGAKQEAWRLIDAGRRIGKATTSAPSGYNFMVNLTQ